MSRNEVQQAGLEPLAELGGMDIYLVDQLMRGRVTDGARIFEAGCGGGRNLELFLRRGFPVAAVDADPGAVAAVRQMAARLAPDLPPSSFHCAPVEESPFPERSFDVVVSCAVLHFARDDAHFLAMLDATWRHVAPRGLFFCRLASSIGLEDRVVPIGSGRYRLPDGSDRFLVDEARLLELTARLGGRLLDPIKTTVVQGMRSMTTWVVSSP